MADSVILQPLLPGLSVSAAAALPSSILPPASKHAGRVLTPVAVADALCSWAIQRPDQTVLDLGVGEGAFALAAVRRLRQLGASTKDAADLIHGAELDSEVHSKAQRAALDELGMHLPHIVHGDFHSAPLPAADAVVGNPPYIRRMYQQPAGRSLAINGLTNGEAVTGLADAYCLFLLRALRVLRPGGRAGVIVSASWLDMNYGWELKRYLLDSFRIHALVSFDGRVFSDALVKPVVLLATRADDPTVVSFSRLKPTAPLEQLERALEDATSGRESPLVRTTTIPQSALSPEPSWSAYLRSPLLHDELTRSAGLVPLAEVARSRIGLQTFAKPFFILSRRDAGAFGIEAEFLLPILPSPRDVSHPVISSAESSNHVLFACERPLDSLKGTNAGRYVQAAMQRTVAVRGSSTTVPGYHLAPRLLRAARKPWFNIRTAVERRGAFPILLPRRVFKTYLVAHNAAGLVANEDFIELEPLGGAGAIEPLLAFLNSSIGEFFVRSQAFQYGGGVFNLNPGRVGLIPVLDPARVSVAARKALVTAWRSFVRKDGSPDARLSLTSVVAEVLSVSPDLLARTAEALDEMVQTALSATESH